MRGEREERRTFTFVGGRLTIVHKIRSLGLEDERRVVYELPPSRQDELAPTLSLSPATASWPSTEPVSR